MQHESAIADDYWNEIFKRGTKDPIADKLQNIEREYREKDFID